MLDDGVVAMLEQRGNYHRVNLPIQVSDVEFEGTFEAVLVGPKDQNGLVVVLDTKVTSINKIRRYVKAFSTVLDRTGSVRPITLVLTSSMSPNDPALVALEDSCRVIRVPPSGNLEEHLRSLLPLRLPDPQAAKKSAGEALRDELGDDARDPFVDALIKAARESSDDVQRTLREEIDRVATLNPAEEGIR